MLISEANFIPEFYSISMIKAEFIKYFYYKNVNSLIIEEYITLIRDLLHSIANDFRYIER